MIVPEVLDASGRMITTGKALYMLARRTARAAGARYYQGSACGCGCTLRYVAGGNCVRCKRAGRKTVPHE